MSNEIWRPCVTRNWESRRHEVSSLGRVRRVDTGEILDLPDGGNVTPHYKIDDSWWSPRILLKIIFPELDKTGRRTFVRPSREEILRWYPSNETEKPEPQSQPKRRRATEKIEIYRPSTEELSSESAEAKLAEMVAQSPPEGDPLVELAQIFYRPKKSSKANDAEMPAEETHEDRVAQAARSSGGGRVHGVAHVLKLYKASAQKRGHDWALTDEQAIYLMVSPCHYCGCAPGTHNQNGLNGIDRKDSGLGYLDNNVVASCGKCNLMKGQRSEVEFVEHAMTIAEYQSRFKVQEVA